jgi:hypothetical protein
VLIELWKRRECEIAHMWNMTNYHGKDAEMHDYRADIVIDHRNRKVKKENIADSYKRRLGGELPTITFSIAIVVACYIGYLRFSRI